MLSTISYIDTIIVHTYPWILTYSLIVYSIHLLFLDMWRRPMKSWLYPCAGPYLRKFDWGGGGGGGGADTKLCPSDNGLLKVVILFLLYNTFQWQLIFFLKPWEGDRPPCPMSKYGPDVVIIAMPERLNYCTAHMQY